jgi:DNA polymerase III delta subunit
VAAVLGRGLAPPLYKLSDALAERRPGPTLALLGSLLEDGEPAQKILAALHRSLRQLLGVRALKAQRASRDEILRRLGVLPFKLGDVMAAADRWSETELLRGLGVLSEADVRMKTGVAAEVALAAAVVGACGTGPGAREGLSPSSRTGR